MRSVWVVNHYATDPSESASGSRHFSLSAHLSRYGWEATILAASTEHPSGRQRIGARARFLDRMVDGVRFRFLRAPSYRGNSLARIANILAFTARLLLPSGTRGLPAPDAVIGSTVHPLAAWAASVLARRHKVPFFFEIRDLWPQTLIDMGKLQATSPAARVLRYVERSLCNRADGVLTLLPFADQYLTASGVPAEKITWVSNGCDTTGFSYAEPDLRDQRFTFMYFGSIGLANGVDNIVRAFAPLAQDARLVIVGGGPSRPAVQTLAHELGIAQAVEFREAIPKARVPEVMADADALVINVLDLPVYRYGISMNKLFDYLAAARPIVIASSAPNNPVVDADAGLSTRASDLHGFTAAMTSVMRSDISDRRRWGMNGRRYVEAEFDYSVLAGKVARALEAVVGEPAGPT